MNIIAVGSRGEGKTTLAMSTLSEKHDGIVVFDPRGMIDGVICWGPDELEKAIDEQKWKDAPLVYRYDSLDNDDEFSAFCSVVFPPNFPRGGFGCLVDEAGWLQGPNSIHPDLGRAIKGHPQQPEEFAITLFQTMHTLSESYGKSRSLIDEYYFFRLTSPNDTKAIVEFTGKPELAEIVRNLPQHHYVRYFNSRRAAGEPEYIIVDDPESWHLAATEPDKKKLDKHGAWESNSSLKVL